MTPLPFAIIDPHIHQWDLRGTPRPATPLVRLLGRFPRVMEAFTRVALPRKARDFVGVFDYALHDYLPQDYRADAAAQPVDAVVHVEAVWQDHSELGPVGETRWLKGLPFDESTVPLGGIVAAADPSSPAFDRLLTAHRRESPLLRGVRKSAARHEDPGVLDSETRDRLYCSSSFLRGFERLAAHGLRFDAWVYSNAIGDVTALATRFPEVPIVLDHLGTPVGVFGPVGKRTGRTAAARARILETWREDIARLAEHPNVRAKLSGLLMPVLGHDDFRRGVRPPAAEIAGRLAPLVEHALDVFGPERCMWASNFPMDKAVADFSAILQAYVELVRPRGEAALRAVFRDNARALYDVALPGAVSGADSPAHTSPRPT